MKDRHQSKPGRIGYPQDFQADVGFGENGRENNQDEEVENHKMDRFGSAENRPSNTCAIKGIKNGWIHTLCSERNRQSRSWNAFPGHEVLFTNIFESNSEDQSATEW
jgi:hypothetical protein